MKFGKSVLCILLSAVLITALISGCTPADSTSSNVSSSSGDDVSSASSDVSSDTSEAEFEPAFSYSDGLDENGYFAGIKALDYVTLLDYKKIVVPADTSEVTDDEVQIEIDALLAEFTTDKEVTDRDVVDGDTVNIDYVGSVDGVEFEGGSTGGSGTEVTIGVTSYIDDFLEQLIGHKPGETFDVNVTFPEDYGKEDLNGKDAVFVTTINFIVEKENPELTDDFVAENLLLKNGWSTVDEMKAGIKEDLYKVAIDEYIRDRFLEIGEISSLPEEVVKFHEDVYIGVQRQYAEMYGMEFEEFIANYGGTTDVNELLANNAEAIERNAQDTLIIQAIAEQEKLTATDEDVQAYFEENLTAEDYPTYETQYGVPYLKQVVMTDKVMDFLQTAVTIE